MRIAVVSDSHIGENSSPIADEFLSELSQYDAIIHAGDFDTEGGLHIFEKLDPPLYAVHGNMDPSSVQCQLDEIKIIEVEGFKIGITHGWGAPFRLHKRIYKKHFSDSSIDLVIFGHSHRKMNTTWNNIHFVNPGAFGKGKSTWAILALKDSTIDISFRQSK